MLPSPSSTPFIHVIPQFIGRLDLSDRSIALASNNDDDVLDPAEAVLRQKMKSKGHPSRKHGPNNAKNIFMRDKAGKSTKSTSPEVVDSSFRTPTLRELYSGVVLTRDQPLTHIGINHTGTDSTLGEDSSSSTLSLGSLYLDYTGPLLRQFVDGWVTNVASPGGYGSVVGKRNAGSVEVKRQKMDAYTANKGLIHNIDMGGTEQKSWHLAALCLCLCLGTLCGITFIASWTNELALIRVYYYCCSRYLL